MFPPKVPGTIVERSVAEFVKQASTGGAYTIPWLEDFGARSYKYGDREVLAQIEASYRSNSSGFFLWNSRVEYHLGALEPVGTYTPSDDDINILVTRGSPSASARGG